MIVVKNGREMVVPEGAMQGSGRMTHKCKCESCMQDIPMLRYTLLPCGCHGLQTHCTCQLRDKLCQACGRIFVSVGGGWYAVDDPHPKAVPRLLKVGR